MNVTVDPLTAARAEALFASPLSMRWARCVVDEVYGTRHTYATTGAR
ncbi:hypothetical protein [Phytohabitans kaempferiae]|uniref:Uncharacterized protein n=1 Tax=Phytohabitans kaempferiae TaxID=1620943 RepID=A0ABV6LYN8_9ACTN